MSRHWNEAIQNHDDVTRGRGTFGLAVATVVGHSPLSVSRRRYPGRSILKASMAMVFEAGLMLCFFCRSRRLGRRSEASIIVFSAAQPELIRLFVGAGIRCSQPCLGLARSEQRFGAGEIGRQAPEQAISTRGLGAWNEQNRPASDSAIEDSGAPHLGMGRSRLAAFSAPARR